MTARAVATGREAFFEIGAVARELGVAPSTLRTWERRYRLIVPLRGASGQRLYDADQVRRLRLIQTQIRRGARAGAAHNAASGPVPLRSEHVELEPSADAPRRARQAVDTVAEAAGNGRFSFFLRLVASELVNNAVMHGVAREPISLDVDLFDDWAQVRVRNAGGRFSLRNLRKRRPSTGRGLEIVDALAEAWTIDSGPFGTTVTVRLPLERAPQGFETSAER